MNMKEFLDKRPLPWEVERQDMSCDGYYDAVLDCNGSQICLEEIVELVNSEFQPLNTKDLPGQSTLEYMCWQGGESTSLVSSASYVHFEKPSTSLEMLCTGRGYVQHKPELVKEVTVNEQLERAKIVNSLRGTITVNEARTKILGWEPLKGERGDQLLE